MGKLVNRAKMTVTGTPGAGAITLNAASTGFQTFAAAGVADGNVVSYTIEDGSNWEVGEGTYTASGTSLARTKIIGSSNGGSAISATSSAIVFVSALATDLVPPSVKYVAGRYYRTAALLSSGASTVAGTLYLHPYFVTDTFTLTSLGVRSNSTGHNIQVAIYASGTNGEPTGSPLASTGNIADATSNFVTGSISSLQLTPGLYWFAVMVDTSSAVTLTTVSNLSQDAQIALRASVPSAVAATQLASSTSAMSLAGTFGTWPDLTTKTMAADYTFVTLATLAPVVIFTPTSVP